MEKLIVKNFGPVKSAEVDLRDFNVFIGHTSSGKSTVAKLFSIVNSGTFLEIGKGGYSSFKKLLIRYNIDFKFAKNTEIIYRKESRIWTIRKNTFETGGALLQNYYTTLEDEKAAYLLNEPSLEYATSNEEKFAEYTFPVNKEKFAAILSEMLETYKKKNREIKSYKPGNQKNDIAKITEMLETISFDMDKSRKEPVYIPAERILMTLFTNSIYSLIKNDINIPGCIKEFGSLYERAKTENRELQIGFMGITVTFSNAGDTISIHENGKKSEVTLTQASSGFQAIIPLVAVLDALPETQGEKRLLIIEEPELNLYPSTQAELMDYIVSVAKKKGYRLIVTTHSPYILSAFDNYILAGELAACESINTNGKKRAGSKVSEIVPRRLHIRFDEISSYFFPSEGAVEDIADPEMRGTGAYRIDEASGKLGDTYDRLSELRRYE